MLGEDYLAGTTAARHFHVQGRGPVSGVDKSAPVGAAVLRIDVATGEVTGGPEKAVCRCGQGPSTGPGAHSQRVAKMKPTPMKKG